VSDESKDNATEQQPTTGDATTGEMNFLLQVADKSARKLAARRDGRSGVWFGLGMSGLIGWSVAVPSLLGAMLGVWLDKNHRSAHSWTLTLLIVGLAIGCWNAWHWVAQEQQAMHDEPAQEAKVKP
jgi:ATP synthase protein I